MARDLAGIVLAAGAGTRLRPLTDMERLAADISAGTVIHESDDVIAELAMFEDFVGDEAPEAP